MSQSDIFAIPIKNQCLLYAPLHSLVALVDQDALSEIQTGLDSHDVACVGATVKPVVHRLLESPLFTPLEKEGPITSPLFLGLITTRNCNMGCIYCDFAASKTQNPAMDLRLARQAVDAYFALLVSNRQQNAQIHFFGGEPFSTKEVIDFVVNYGIIQSQKLDMSIHFEVITNGVFSPERAHWIGEYFDTVIISLDGPPEVQNRNRPGVNGKALFDVVYRSAKILSDSSAELIIRSCVTDDIVDKIPSIAEWIAAEFRPSAWCIEPLTQSSPKEHLHLLPPDPWRFAVNFDRASQILAPYGIEVVNSTVELGNLRLTCCPVGQDALIISPEGFIDACYLIERDWVSRGMNMRFGEMGNRPEDEKKPGTVNLADILESVKNNTKFHIDREALDVIRKQNVNQRSLCQDCLCRYSCAGGCHVNHDTRGKPGEFDDLCIYTRLITIAKLMRSLGCEELVSEWLADKQALENSVWRKSDRILTTELVVS